MPLDLSNIKTPPGEESIGGSIVNIYITQHKYIHRFPQFVRDNDCLVAYDNYAFKHGKAFTKFDAIKASCIKSSILGRYQEIKILDKDKIIQNSFEQEPYYAECIYILEMPDGKFMVFGTEKSPIKCIFEINNDIVTMTGELNIEPMRLYNGVIALI